MIQVDRFPYDIHASKIKQVVGTEAPFIIEVGANDCETTKTFLDEMPNARVVAFEPDPRPIARCVCLHDQRVTFIQCAIGDYSGEATLYQSGGEVPRSTAPCAKDWDYSNSIHKPTGHFERDKVVKFPTTITVPVRRLDDYLSLFPQEISLIFADVQGAEARLILGAQETLRRTRWLYIEFYDVEQYERQPDLKGILSFLPDWELRSTWGDNALLENRIVAKGAP